MSFERVLGCDDTTLNLSPVTLCGDRARVRLQLIHVWYMTTWIQRMWTMNQQPAGRHFRNHFSHCLFYSNARHTAKHGQQVFCGSSAAVAVLSGLCIVRLVCCWSTPHDVYEHAEHRRTLRYFFFFFASDWIHYWCHNRTANPQSGPRTLAECLYVWNAQWSQNHPSSVFFIHFDEHFMLCEDTKLSCSPTSWFMNQSLLLRMYLSHE